MQQMLGPRSRVLRSSQQVSCDLAGEAAILHLADGVYYGLDRVGATIWNLLDRSRTLEELRDEVMAEYDVAAAECERDIVALINDLWARGLVLVENDGDAP
ncbi:MAG TPA: PqqD family protein [Candidatus Kapabacteria bacterium]|nr:PqqD family protein [Candidatus Kapabacteria bacterium]